MTLPTSSFPPRKVLRPPLTFLMWSRNSGEERQSSGLENWRQLYWKRGSRSGSRSNSLWVEARCQPWGVAPVGSVRPGCPAAGEGGQSLGCELQHTLQPSMHPLASFAGAPLSPLPQPGSGILEKTMYPQASHTTWHRVAPP